MSPLVQPFYDPTTSTVSYVVRCAVQCLPAETRIYVCHDYQPGGRAPAWQTSVGKQRAGNIHIRDGIDEVASVALRTERDWKLPPPRC
jgi:hypothetical protein